MFHRLNNLRANPVQVIGLKFLSVVSRCVVRIGILHSRNTAVARDCINSLRVSVLVIAHAVNVIRGENIVSLKDGILNGDSRAFRVNGKIFAA